MTAAPEEADMTDSWRQPVGTPPRMSALRGTRATTAADDTGPMRRKRTTDRGWAAVLAGVLAANSTPHLVTAARRGRMLTPLAGQDSGPIANLPGAR